MERVRTCQDTSSRAQKKPSILVKDEKLPWYHLYSEEHCLSALVIR